MSDDKQPISRAYVLGLALVCGFLLSIAVRTILAHTGLDLAALWRGLHGPQAAQLKAAFVWWLLAAFAVASGLVIAIVTKVLSRHPIRSPALCWIAGAIFVTAATALGHEAAAPSDLPPAASVGIGLVSMGLTGVLSLLGAFFVVRR